MAKVDSLSKTPFGPEFPPSKWPLQGVPVTISDLIIEDLAGQARLSYSCDPLKSLPEPFRRDAIPVTPLSTDLKHISSVDRSFRRAVRKRVLESVVFASRESVDRELDRLEKGDYIHIK